MALISADWPDRLVRWWVTQWWDPLLSWLYPPRQSCLSCGMALTSLTAVSLNSWFPDSPEIARLQSLFSSPSMDSVDTAHYICMQCASSILLPHSDLLCDICGRSNSDEEQPADEHIDHTQSLSSFICSDCAQNKPLFVAARSFSQFQGLIQAWVARYKFGREMELEPLLGCLLSLAYWEYYRDIPFDAIVPVPLHPSRLSSRGFNQAEQIAQYLIPLACAPCTQLLQRIKFTGSQTSHSRSGRLAQENGGYRIDPTYAADVPGRKILLVDDVYTTGTTARLCSSALIAAGASSVHVLTLGR